VTTGEMGYHGLSQRVDKTKKKGRKPCFTHRGNIETTSKDVSVVNSALCSHCCPGLFFTQVSHSYQPFELTAKNVPRFPENGRLWFGPFPCNGSLRMGKSASLRPPMPLVAVRRLWVAMAAGLCSAKFSVSLLPNPGGRSLDSLTIGGNKRCASSEAAGRKLEFFICLRSIGFVFAGGCPGAAVRIRIVSARRRMGCSGGPRLYKASTPIWHCFDGATSCLSPASLRDPEAMGADRRVG